MKQSTRLSLAVFQLTPTRTRCDLIIIANDKKEKIASGLLNPFLAHLKTAQDQIAKGGYSILLEPETGSDAAWFTKATLERFVRFVSTPEILERVYTIETEILQIEEAMAMQRRNDMGQSIVENHQIRPRGGSEGDKSAPHANEEKAIVLYTPGASAPEANGSCSQEGNSKVQLLKVLDTRKAVLQKEQGMAFARAVAAGFDIDHMEALVSFAECFGAMRLMEACSRFMDLWKSKHETGQWLDVEASGAFSTQSDFTAMNASCIILSDTPNKCDISNHMASDNNGKSCSTNNADNPVPNGPQEYFQGQFPHLAFPPWPMHASPGGQPVFQAYPAQGMPYYQAYAGNGPPFQPPHYPMEHSSPNFGPHSGQKRQSLDVRDSNSGSEMWEIDRTRSLDDMESDDEISQSRKSRKKAGGSKKQSGMVVIRNINYITSKEKKSGSETNSDSHSDIDTDNEYLEADGNYLNYENNKRSSRRRGVDKLNLNKDEVATLGKDTDDRHWKAFQDCLLRGTDKDARADNEDMFALENDVKIKRQASKASDDPLVLGAQDRGETQDNRMRDFRRISGSTSYRPRGSRDEVLFSSADNDFKGSNDHADIQFAETNGRKILFSTTHEDFIIGSQRNQANTRNSSDPLTMNGFQGASNKLDRDSSHGMADESLIVPFRSMSLQAEGTERITLDIDSEIPSKYQKLESEGNKKIVNYEPNDLSMMPERGTDRRSFGYDLALDYEMQVCAEGSEEKEKKDITDVKGGTRISDKDRRSKVMLDSLQKQRTGGPMRKGKSTKMSPLEDARARAERLRSYKADLQKMKKEQEEAELKRLESLKLERKKRIAARGGSAAAKPSTLSPQTKQLPSNLSVTPNRGSKFSDSEPGSSSPLQRSKVRTPLGSSESHKASKASKLSEGSHTAGNRLIRSMPSLSEAKKETKGLTPDPKATMSRIRRLSEPKKITTPPVTTMKTRSAEAVTKRKLSEGPERNKVSAIINLDKSKAATLPELKIKTPVLHVNKGENRSAVKDKQEVNGTRPFLFPENAEQNVDNCNTAHQIDADDNPIVEKTVLVLEREKPPHPILYSSKGNPEVQVQQHKNHDKGEKSHVISESAPIRDPPSHMDRVDREPVSCPSQKPSDYNEVGYMKLTCFVYCMNLEYGYNLGSVLDLFLFNASYAICSTLLHYFNLDLQGEKFRVKTAYSDKDPPNIANITTTEKPYQAPYARVSSLEDPCTHHSEYGKAPVGSLEALSRAEETVKTRVPDVKAFKMETKKVTPEKSLVKEPSKGLRRLLKFGKKTTSSVDQSVDSECSGGTGIKHHENARKTASTSEVYTLKNLISQDEPSTAGNAPQKTSRHFSLFSPFRSKTSEKKQAS
ncbi:UNVERIFIED_CONTAM: COP1-interacting protein 7 [Sesamum calycinum]|uniref:COP1-interacting protein 7 n=1 Tax=Sesamum calycinum TaxID=2727403 RepID=A0AAW2QLG6_9LAMI